MIKYSENDAIKVILNCAKQYEEYLLNRKFLFIYRGKQGEYGHIEVLFRPKHFMHLTGSGQVEDKTAIHFFSKCIDNTLTAKDIIKTDMMDLKLAVLPGLMKIHKNARMTGSFKGGSLQQLYTERIAGNSRGCMGFVFDKNECFLVPNTVLNGNTREMIIDNNQIMAVYKAAINSAKYDTFCYIAKNSDLSKKDPLSLVWPEEIKNKIDSDSLTIDRL